MFLRRDFTHPDHTPNRKRERALTKFYSSDGKLVAAYSYNTAIAVVVPDVSQVSGIRVYLNRTYYSMGTNVHAADVRCELARDYTEQCVEVAGDSYTVPVGTGALELATLCGRDTLPWYVRERPLRGHVHLTRADHRRYNRGEKIYGHSDGSSLDVLFLTRDGEEYMLTVSADGLDVCADQARADEDDYTVSPDLYAWLIALRGKAVGVAEARGDAMRCTAYGRYLDLTYSKRSA